MRKDEFLARCANAYDMGLIGAETMNLLLLWTDFVLRFEHTLMGNGQTQGAYVLDFIEAERNRLHDGKTLAGDELGYALIRLCAIFTHHCQLCATDPNAWHTRAAFCDHAKDAKETV